MASRRIISQWDIDALNFSGPQSAIAREGATLEDGRRNIAASYVELEDGMARPKADAAVLSEVSVCPLSKYARVRLGMPPTLTRRRRDGRLFFARITY